MKMLVVDDEPLALNNLVSLVKTADPDAEVTAFDSSRKALEYAKGHAMDIAVLDIELSGQNGLALAKELKELYINLRVIFVTSFEKYALDAFSVHASGYLLKPVKLEDIRRELTFAYGVRLTPPGEKKIRVQTFGGFDVFVDGKPLYFKRSKSKELLAYLVDRRGASVTTREACAVLWEDSVYDTAQKNYFQVIVMELKAALRRAGVGELLKKRRNFLAIDADQVDCDSYRYMDGDPQAINSYHRDYMLCYSWAEFTMGRLENYEA